MPNESKVYLEDILVSIERIETYTRDFSYEEFAKNYLIIDAVVRNLEIIGEAVKKLPVELKDKYSEVEWKKVAGLRDILIHEYSGVDLRIVWDIITHKVPELKRVIKKITVK